MKPLHWLIIALVAIMGTAVVDNMYRYPPRPLRNRLSDIKVPPKAVNIPQEGDIQIICHQGYPYYVISGKMTKVSSLYKNPCIQGYSNEPNKTRKSNR